MNFLVQTVLSPKYHLLPVVDVYQAMGELKRRDKVELLIIDIDYHTQENWDFIRHIKTSGLYQDTRIIVLSSDESPENIEALLSGDIKVFHKPFSPLQLVKDIDEMLLEQSVNPI